MKKERKNKNVNNKKKYNNINLFLNLILKNIILNF